MLFSFRLLADVRTRLGVRCAHAASVRCLWVIGAPLIRCAQCVPSPKGKYSKSPRAAVLRPASYDFFARPTGREVGLLAFVLASLSFDAARTGSEPNSTFPTICTALRDRGIRTHSGKLYF